MDDVDRRSQRAEWHRFSVYFIALICIYLVCVTLAYNPIWGTPLLLELLETIVLPGMVCVFAGYAAICYGAALMKKRPGFALQYIVFAIAVFSLFFVAMFMESVLQRWLALRIMNHGDALVQVIKRYESTHGYPPANLKEVVPDEKSSILLTGLGGSPQFEYNKSGSPYLGNWDTPWVVSVDIPVFPPGYSNTRLVYSPLEQYPERAARWGRFTPVGNWAIARYL